MTIVSIEFIVKGTVQGVGFRYFVKGVARAEGLVGWVKNDMGGDVVGIAQGRAVAIERLKEHLSIGPRHSKVTEVEIKSESTIDRPQFSSFDIVH